uniref:Uncharacterized protein n=1 Tax=Mantoniella antarctica TaxID=81844 RepID=A0A7S0SPH9_9CHLO|mmetsp:Transcript_33206/g.83751  ORF Transcript_33206/g.83751 Transcript_33206/m.83751 type:complete len:171 (+) Transcript_33206:141-653(+)|eukprot:CAMPEP_0181361000 /NCGR_PEP_ID=MMETSP1106-20121128/7024_1 /TAXON_ID=81844 /ORGANISM="Mantoniella antarctica, Strain SL-175" /LENGTH=170 /DNA_ID=CAMNT_0023474427 /DNA_START=137 /DNA_END=649 /DNA_ORIENTATION=+
MSVVLSAQFATKVHFLKAKRVSGIKSSRVSRATVAAGAGKKPDDDEKPRGFPSGGGSSSRGPGAAPLRMETGDQRKFGYGGDGMPPDDGDEDDGWEPGGDGSAPSPWGLFILLAAGAWALWEYKRPGGTLNPQTKKDAQLRFYRAQLAMKKKRLEQQGGGGGTGKINVTG